MERSNFHEDDLRHYVIKLGNAREDGHKINQNISRRPSKKTMQELYEAGKIDAARAEQWGVQLSETDKFLQKLDPHAAALLRGVLGSMV